MFLELIERVDGRKWIQAVDRRIGDGQRLVELLPSGASGVGPTELISITLISPVPPLELSVFPKLSAERLRGNCLDGNLSAVFVRESPQEVAFSISVMDDTLIGDAFHAYRIIKGALRLAVMTYEHRGPIGNEDRALWAQKLLKIPLQDLTDAAVLAEPGRCERRPFFREVRDRLVELGAREPNLAANTEGLVEGIDRLAHKEPSAEFFAHVLLMIPAVLRLNDERSVIDPASADELTTAAQAIAESFGRGPKSEFYHLALSILGRVLVEDPRLGSAALERGMRISRHLFSLEEQIPRTRLEEAALSFLQGANRLAVVTRSDDFGERTGWLREWLINSPFEAARVLARMALKRTALETTSRNGLLEHLNKSDVMTHVMDNLTFVGKDDSSLDFLASAQEGAKDGPYGLKELTGGFSAMGEMLAECPPEMRLSTMPERQNKFWGKDRAPFVALRTYSAQMAIDAQAELYGLEYTQQKSLMRQLSENGPERESPGVLFLRNFASMRRLLVENTFEHGNPDILPFYSEPPVLSLESTLNRALAMHFSPVTVGGMFDAFGMGRLHGGGRRMDGGLEAWKSDVLMLLSTVRFVLLLPDSSSGLQWEIQEVIRRGMANQTIFVMLPETVDPTAAKRWDEFLSALPKTLPDCPRYLPAGAFVFVPRDRHGYQTLPFGALFSGGLARLLLDL